MLAEDTSRLERIDKLYALRLDRYVSLPMLVVVGDQSCGKSSVLEGLTGLPFPRDAGLCTRFPTQVVFKRSADTQIEGRIMPIDLKSEQDGCIICHLPGMSCDEFSKDQFQTIFSKACQQMNLPSSDDLLNEGMKSFSHDVLKIELSGPDYEHFSVVDLPGLFRKPTPGRTTKDDMKVVRQMVQRYVDNERCIILAVVPANVDIATQEIVQLAEDADPKGKRTLGVITKPDLVDRGAEEKVIGLVSGQGGQYGLGYTIVCNRSQSNLGSKLTERNAIETSFLSESPWSAIPSDRRGIVALKRRLDGLLVDLARKKFQEVACDISEAIDACTERLHNLGPQRCDQMTQQTHLLRIATTFQSLTSHALDAYYARDSCFTTRDDLRLATTIKVLQDEYSSVLRKKGRTRYDRLRKDTATAQDEGDSGNVLTPQGGQSSTGDLIDSSDVGEPSDSDQESPSELEAPIELRRILFQIKRPCNPPRETTIPWIRREFHRSKGFEIGTINPSLLPALYHEQIKNWKYYTLDHMNKVLKAIHSFIYQLLDFVCSDHQICERMWAVLSPHVVYSYKRALEHVTLLLQIEEAGNLRTLNHYFTLTLNKLRLRRVTKRLASAKSWTTPSEGNEPLIRLTDVLDSYKSNDDQLVEDLDDILRSYYKLAQKQFVDAVCKGAVDYLLLTVADGPLRVFSPAFIGSLTGEQLSHIAGESLESARLRAEITGELQVLREGHAVVND